MSGPQKTVTRHRAMSYVAPHLSIIPAQGNVHSFLIFDTIFFTSTLQPASTLPRSTTSSEWRCG